MKSDFAGVMSQVTEYKGDIEDLADKVSGAADEVLGAILDVNEHITRSEELLNQVEEASGDIVNLSVQSTTLDPNSLATVSYSDGVITFGIPKGDTGDAFHIVKIYDTIGEMNSDYSNTSIHVGDFVMVVSTVEDPDNAKIYIKGSTQFECVVDMSGATGIRGPAGVSPQVSISSVTNGHRVSITDSTTTHDFDVMNGIKGDSVSNVEFDIDSDGYLKYLVTITEYEQ